LDAENNKLRISFIVGSLAQGGAEKQLLYILRTLKKLGYPIQALLLSRSEYYEQVLADLDIPTITIGKGMVLLRLIRICEEIRKFGPDLIQSTHFFASFYAGAAGKILHIPSIGAIRGDFYHDLSGVNYLGRMLLTLPTVFVANSNNARQNAIQSGLDPQRIFVLGNVIDIQEFDQQGADAEIQRFPPGKVVITTVARVIKIKRLERFIIAIAQARRIVPNIIGAVIGDGPEMERLRGLASHLGLLDQHNANGIIFLGKRSDIPQLLKHSDIFVLTSDQEGFPNVFLEAMAASLPILSTPAGEAPQLIEDGVNGYIIQFNDRQNLKNKMINLAVSSATRRKLGNNGRLKVCQEYDLEILDYTLETLYSNIMAYLRDKKIKQKRQTQGMSKQA
jgi:glycosyltransferase involved in cell wall biosynthesis